MSIIDLEKKRAYQRAWQAKPENRKKKQEYYRKHASTPEFKEKRAQSAKRYMAKPENKDRRNRYMRERYTSDYRWKLHIKSRFGMVIDDYQKILGDQKNSCAICKEPIRLQSTPHGTKGKFDIDHCHVTGQVRGLLCKRCNKGLGAFKDSAERVLAAVEYLKRESTYNFFYDPKGF